MTARLTRKKVLRWTRNAVLISVAVHVLFAVGAAFVIALRTTHKPEAVFQGDPPPRPRLPPRKLEMKVKVKDLQKRSARPKVQPRLAAPVPSDIALPEIKNIPKENKKIQRNVATLGVSGFGQGIGGGFGTGMGGGISFFGLKGVGQRHLFVVDLSGSMSPQQLKILKDELIDSLEQLQPGMEYQVICFAGPVWFLGDTVEKKPEIHGDRTAVIRTKDGDVYRWLVRGMTDIELLGNRKRLPVQAWRPATRANLEESIDAVKDWSVKNKVLGTTWILPLRTALDMKPSADVIYFMTDGAAANMPESVAEITQLNRDRGIVINAIAMVSEEAGQTWLKNLAEQNGGSYTFAK